MCVLYITENPFKENAVACITVLTWECFHKEMAIMWGIHFDQYTLISLLYGDILDTLCEYGVTSGDQRYCILSKINVFHNLLFNALESLYNNQY